MYPFAPVTQIVFWSDGETAAAAPGWDKVVKRPEAADPPVMAALLRKLLREEAPLAKDSSDNDVARNGKIRPEMIIASGNGDADFILAVLFRSYLFLYNTLYS